MGKSSRAKAKKRELDTMHALFAKHDLVPDLREFGADLAGRVGLLSYVPALAHALQQLDGGLTAESVKAALKNIHEVVTEVQREESNRIVTMHDGSTRRIACKAGCDYCCTIRIGLTPPEALLIADFLESRLQKDQLETLVESMEAFSQATMPLDSVSRMEQRIRCPLLHLGSCSIYPVRPSNCRGYNSLDVEVCKVAHLPGNQTQVPTNPLFRIGEAAASRARRRAFDKFGLDTREVELIPAILIALKRADRWDAFLASEDLFAGARRPDVVAESNDRFSSGFGSNRRVQS